MSPLRTLCLLLTALAFPATAGAVPFANPFLVERYELSGSVAFADEFDDGIFPGAAWAVLCGAASEGGGALSVEATGPGILCPFDAFVAGPIAVFLNSTTLTADFRLPLPADGEAVGIQVATLDGGDMLNLVVTSLGGQIALAVNDENGLQAVLDVEPSELPAATFTLEIALLADLGTGILVPTLGASADGNPLFQETLDPSLGLDPSQLGVNEFFVTGVVAAFVPEPAAAVLLLPTLAALGRRARSR